ncbi:hypothetical protein ACQPW1_30315 [Nocardia sp. CA-128927]|uniref:hypothetical protein n=1 Tax=Nocardia sp. CA-128927 TaxID=3239975 RepID=UPI003D96AADF
MAVLEGHTASVLAVACAVVDGRPAAVTGGMDRTVRMWDLTSAELIGMPRQLLNAWMCELGWGAGDPHGRAVAQGSGGTPPRRTRPHPILSGGYRSAAERLCGRFGRQWSR